MRKDGKHCEILTTSRKISSIKLTTTFTGRLRPCVTMTIIPATTHPTNCHKNIGPPYFGSPGPKISKHLDPRNKMFEIFGPRNIYPPYKIYLNTISTCVYERTPQFSSKQKCFYACGDSMQH